MVSVFVPGPISGQESIEVPLGAIGHVIGEAGYTIKHIQQITGAQIDSPRREEQSAESGTFRITGTRRAIDFARDRIQSIIAAWHAKQPSTDIPRKPGGTASPSSLSASSSLQEELREWEMVDHEALESCEDQDDGTYRMSVFSETPDTYINARLGRQSVAIAKAATVGDEHPIPINRHRSRNQSSDVPDMVSAASLPKILKKSRRDQLWPKRKRQKRKALLRIWAYLPPRARFQKAPYAFNRNGRPYKDYYEKLRRRLQRRYPEVYAKHEFPVKSTLQHMKTRMIATGRIVSQVETQDFEFETGMDSCGGEASLLLPPAESSPRGITQSSSESYVEIRAESAPSTSNKTDDSIVVRPQEDHFLGDLVDQGRASNEQTVLIGENVKFDFQRAQFLVEQLANMAGREEKVDMMHRVMCSIEAELGKMVSDAVRTKLLSTIWPADAASSTQEKGKGKAREDDGELPYHSFERTGSPRRQLFVHGTESPGVNGTSISPSKDIFNGRKVARQPYSTTDSSTNDSCSLRKRKSTNYTHVSPSETESARRKSQHQARIKYNTSSETTIEEGPPSTKRPSTQHIAESSTAKADKRSQGASVVSHRSESPQVSKVEKKAKGNNDKQMYEKRYNLGSVLATEASSNSGSRTSQADLEISLATREPTEIQRRHTGRHDDPVCLDSPVSEYSVLGKSCCIEMTSSREQTGRRDEDKIVGFKAISSGEGQGKGDSTRRSDPAISELNARMRAQSAPASASGHRSVAAASPQIRPPPEKQRTAQGERGHGEPVAPPRLNSSREPLHPTEKHSTAHRSSPAAVFPGASFTPINPVRGLVIRPSQFPRSNNSTTTTRNLPDSQFSVPRSDTNEFNGRSDIERPKLGSTHEDDVTAKASAASRNILETTSPQMRHAQHLEPPRNLRHSHRPTRLGRHEVQRPHPDMMRVPCFCQDLPRSFWEATDRLPQPKEINLGWRMWQEIVFSIQTTRLGGIVNVELVDFSREGNYTTPFAQQYIGSRPRTSKPVADASKYKSLPRSKSFQ
ncbi:hypothetical protein E2P81_ATG00638 [Venturia nashicola]|nr:hypothetical protein E2P81_ATG00638 [Venturia nashicola]